MSVRLIDLNPAWVSHGGEGMFNRAAARRKADVEQQALLATLHHFTRNAAGEECCKYCGEQLRIGRPDTNLNGRCPARKAA